MKKLIIIAAIFISFFDCAKGDDSTVKLEAEIRALTAEIATSRQSEAFRRDRSELGRTIEKYITMLEKAPTITPGQMKWVVNAGRAGKQNNHPYYKPYLTRLYAIYKKHSE